MANTTLDPAEFPFTRTLEAAYPIILEEMMQLDNDAFVPWSLREAYCGEWLIYPLLVNQHTHEIHCDLETNRRRCPRTYDIVRQLPGVLDIGFSRLMPGTHVYPHVDLHGDQPEVRCHLPLVIPEGSLIRVGDQVSSWTAGKCRVLDPTIEHEAGNRGSSARTVLLGSFRLPRPLSSYGKRAAVDRGEPRLQ